MEVKIKLAKGAVLPKYAKQGDAGMDLTAISRTCDIDGNMVHGTGVYLEIPMGFVGLLFPRSSICKQDLTLSNAVGVLDSGYRGEVMFKFKPTLSIYSKTTESYNADFDSNTMELGFPESEFFECYKIGDRIGQLIILPYPKIEFKVVDELSTSERGEGGYGSTNNN